MKTVIKYLSFSLLFVVLLAISLPFVPPVTKSLLQSSLRYFLKVDADVATASLSLHGLEASGRLDQNDSFTLSAKPHSLTRATVTLHYDGNVNTFSNIATVELPRIAAVLDATFTTWNRQLEVNATLLDGTLKGDVSFVNWDYRYQMDNVDLTSFRTQQKNPIPDYATGRLSAKGSGIIEKPYTVNFFLESRDLQLEKNATILLSPELEHPLPLALELNGSVGSDALESKVALQSALTDVAFDKLSYVFDQSRFQVRLEMLNHKDKILPLKHAALDLNGSLGKDDLNASYLLSVDDYRLLTDRLRYDFNSSDLNLDYRLTSLTEKPLNIQGDHALFGELNYANGNLSVIASSKALKSPVLLTLKDDQLHLISNNMPLEPLQVMANQEIRAQGNATVEADANLSSEPLLWKAKVQSKNLKLPWKYRKDLGLKNDIALTVDANSETDGDIVVRPALWSNIGIVNDTALRYRPDLQRLYFNLNAKMIKTTYYQAPKLNIRGALDIKQNRLNKTTLTTPYETIVVKDLSYSEQDIRSHVEFVMARLDRFARLNRDYRLSGKSYLNYTPRKTTVKLDVKELGSLRFEQKNKQINVAGKKLPVEEILRLTDQPVVMKGNLDYNLRYTSSSIKANVTSDKLSGYGDLSNSIRPFSLEHNLSLKYKDSRYRGNAAIKTDNERLTVPHVVLDLSKKTLKSRYKLDIKALEKNTIILPKELKGPLRINGEFEQDGDQHLTLNLLNFQLPKKWHKMLNANATDPLETNASLQAYNTKGFIDLNGTVDNRLFQVRLRKSDYDLKSGDFHLNGDLKTKQWPNDTDIAAIGSYRKGHLYLSQGDIATGYETISLQNLHYTPKEQNLTTEFQLRLKPYPNAPYHATASINGRVQTKPELYAIMKSDSMGGELNANLTDTDLHLTATKVSVPILVAFSGLKIPIGDGTLDSTVNISSPSFTDGNLSTIKGRSDIRITDMVLKGVDLDDTLETLRNSQDLNLFQGSFAELPIVRSLKDIPADIMKKEDVKSTRFGDMRFLTDIDNAAVHCVDCAVATEENLVAVRGDVNLTTQTFENFYIGLLYPTYCAYFIQQVEGNVSAPQIELAAAGFNVVGGATKSLIGNIGGILDLGADIVKSTGSVVGDVASYVPVLGETTDKALTSVTDAPKDISSAAMECTPFYSGAVRHPKPVSESRLKKTMKEIQERSKERKAK